MTPPAPNLLPIHNYHILETRNRKLLKLCIMKEKSLARRSIVHEEQDEQDESDANMILSQLNHSNYSAPSSTKEENSDDEVPLQVCRVTTASRIMHMSAIGPVPATTPHRTSTCANTPTS